MEYFNDFINVYKKAGKETLATIKKAPLIIFAGLFYSLVYTLTQMLAITIGLASNRFWGIISPFIFAVCLSGFFSQLDEAINFKRLNTKGFLNGFVDYFYSIYFITFIYYLYSILLARLNVRYILDIVSFILFNAIGEVIYIKKTSQLDGFSSALDYLKDNWYIWIPHILLLLLMKPFMMKFYISPNPLNIYLDSLALFSPITLGKYLILGVYFVFRGILYKNTRSSSMRKRKYMGAWE